MDHADAVLDALALIEARLRDDGQALTHLLDAGDNRAQASMAADIAAHLMRVLAPADPLGMIARYLRPALLDGGQPPQ